MASAAAEPVSAHRLREAISPYLRQHAGNPVDWWPWCEEALERARSEDRPILLSIGYAACHWCHVMAHESFEDTQTAALMNRLFINIKVDREERPDLDHVYQTAHQVLVRRGGGWPLTAFLTPQDQRPFFIGTYFPPTPRGNMPAFAQVLQGVADAYRQQRAAIDLQNRDLMNVLESLAPEPGSLPDAGLLERADEALAANFDAIDGGFGGAPKFPQGANLAYLLARGETAAPGAHSPRELALFSLRRMIQGGLYDQLGGGFYRYSVDAGWMIPHFEKMLYDNGVLLALCASAHAATGEELFAQAAAGTADWVLREMQAPEGGFHASLDADSEGEEGRFYLWTRREVRERLPQEQAALFSARYGLEETPNFEGRWHLHQAHSLAEVAKAQGLGEAQARAQLAAAQASLFALREERVRPACDEKILTSWNALMILGLARAAREFSRPDWLAGAERALGRVRSQLWRDGELLASARGERAHLPAYLDDHAYLIAALLELLQTRWSSEDLEFARTLADTLLARFHDPETGGFWFTSTTHETLIHRTKPLADDSIPSGNAVAALALLRLGHLLGESRYLQAAEGTLALAADALQHQPIAHGAMLLALREWLEPPEVCVVRAPAAELGHWRTRLQQGAPQRLVLAIGDEVDDLPGVLGAMAAGAGPRLYRCRGTHCEAPIELTEDSLS